MTTIDALVKNGVEPSNIGLVMSDRTAERHFSIGERLRSELRAPLSPPVFTTAKELRPLAPLGAPATGTVGAGPITSKLASAGLGSACGLDGALERLGLEHEHARAIVREIVRGAVLVSAEVSENGPPEELVKRFAESGAPAWRLAGDDSGVVELRAPMTPAGDQRPEYEPVIAPETLPTSRPSR
jgi:hypothetical protein